jgi:hypothetical protein
MKKSIKSFLAVTLGLAIIVISCVSPKEQKVEDETSTQIDSTISIMAMEYLIPSPSEVLGMIQDMGLDFNMKLVNPLRSPSEFMLFKNQALNLGCYLTDFSYLLLFDKHPESIKYLYHIQEMSVLLGIENHFNDDFFNSILSNLNQPDTVKELALDQSAQFLKKMESTGRKDLALLVTTGAMIEVIYLSSEILKENQITDNLVSTISNLAIVFDNFYLHYSSAITPDESMIKLTTDLQEIRNVFTSMSIQQTSSTIRKEGKIIVSTRSQNELSDYNISKLKAIISKVRSNIINQEY